MKGNIYEYEEVCERLADDLMHRCKQHAVNERDQFNELLDKAVDERDEWVSQYAMANKLVTDMAPNRHEIWDEWSWMAKEFNSVDAFMCALAFECMKDHALKYCEKLAPRYEMEHLFE